MQREYDEENVITNKVRFNHQVQCDRKKIDDDALTYRFDYRQKQPDGFASAEEQAQLNLALEKSQIQRAMCETLGDYRKQQLQARYKEDINNILNPDFGQNKEENQNLTRLKLSEDKYFDIDNISLSSSEKVFQTSERKKEDDKSQTFHAVNPYQQETDQDIAMRLQQELNTEIEKSDEKLASELRDEDILARLGEFKNRDIAKSNANLAPEMSHGEMEPKFETEFANLHKKIAKDDEKLPESELQEIDFSKQD